MVSVFNFISYKDFILAYYKEQKQNNTKFSYQYFADKAGLSTKTFIPKIISGEKKLAQRSTIMIIKAMGLNKRESNYFESLVNFNNAIDIDEKEFYFHRLQELGKKSKYHKSRENEFFYFSRWYHVVIYELIPLVNWNGNYKTLGKYVNPPITDVKAKKAVKLMTELDLLRETSPGKYIQTGEIKIDNYLKQFAIRKFHQQVLDQGLEALKSYDKQCVSTITGSVSSREFEDIKRKIEKFRREIIELIDSTEQKEKIILMNIQLFPVSKKINQ